MCAAQQVGAGNLHASAAGDVVNPVGPPKVRRWYRAARGLALAAVCLFALRMAFVDGIVRPVRIVSGSMADSLFGPHYRIPCDDCGATFRCGVENPPTNERAVCPNCGYRGNAVSREQLRPGDRVLIDRLAWLFREPARWEAVAFQSPDDESLSVKRIVGLPGEQITIDRGDVFANGRLVCKSLDELRRLAVLVHDSKWEPADASLPPRWRSAAPSGWKREGAAFVHGRSVTDDWLEWHHWPCYAGPAGRTATVPVKDTYAYNQSLSRNPRDVAELLLVARVVLSGNGPSGEVRRDEVRRDEVRRDEVRRDEVRRGGSSDDGDNGPRTSASGLTIRFRHGGAPSGVVFQLATNDEPDRVFATRRGVESVRVARRLPRDEVFEVAVARCDGQTLVSIDRENVIRHRWPVASSGREVDATGSPLAISTRMAMRIERLQVWRDVYYLPPHEVGDWWRAKRCGADGYLVLGDNAPLSRDSRYWAVPGVNRSRLRGKVIRLTTH